MDFAGDFDMDFVGAKVALFIGARLLVVLRDDKPSINWPAYWDFPGGGREGDETPEETCLRETREEVGLALSPDDFVWKRECVFSPGRASYFFAAHLPEGAEQDIVFGDEGQRWELWSPADYMSHPRGIPHFKTRLAAYLTAAGLHGM
ncbi:MAG: NUDIX hydrolase [Pseudomonadota bacterium]